MLISKTSGKVGQMPKIDVLVREYTTQDVEKRHSVLGSEIAQGLLLLLPEVIGIFFGLTPPGHHVFVS